MPEDFDISRIDMFGMGAYINIEPHGVRLACWVEKLNGRWTLSILISAEVNDAM